MYTYALLSGSRKWMYTLSGVSFFFRLSLVLIPVCCAFVYSACCITMYSLNISVPVVTARLVSLYVASMTNQRGHWVCWLSTGRENGFMSMNTHVHVY